MAVNLEPLNINLSNWSFSADGKIYGKYPAGNAPVGGSPYDWDANYTSWINSVRSGSATTYYVDPVSGNNANNGLTTGTAFADPTAAYSVMSGGDEIVIIGDSITITDNDAFAFNDYEHAIPAGTSRTARTIIRAQTPFGVRIKFTANTRNFNYEAVRFNTNNYMLVDGFIIEWLGDGGEPMYVCTAQADENIMTRCIIKRDSVGSFGGFASWPGSYGLLQDVHGVGGARYGFQMGGGTTNPASKSIIRRSVARIDFCGSNQPMASFAHYGNNSGTASRETEFQNCISIDGPYIDTGLGSDSYTYGGFYNPKNAYNIRHRGCMVINQGGRAGIHVTDNNSDLNYVVEHCVVAGENATKYGTRVGVRANNTSGTADYLTLVDIDGADLFGGVTATNTYASDTEPASIFNATGGADVRYAYGALGSVWGQTDFDSVTTGRLWPFPYEDKIRSVFSEQMDSPSGYTPSTNTSARGFCAAEQTLSKYIASWSIGDPQTVLDGLY